MLQTRWRSLLVAAGTMVAAAGCVGPMLTGEQPRTSSPGKVSLFPNSNGMGAITMRVFDERKAFGTQAVADADDWDRIDVALSSTTALHGTKTGAIPSAPGNNRQTTYSANLLSELPPASDYRLLVAVATGSAVLGQGASESIVVKPGETTAVNIYINALGQIKFWHPIYKVLTGNYGPTVGVAFPEVLAGSTVSVKTEFPFNPADPADQHVTEVQVEVRDLGEVIKVATDSATASVAVVAASRSADVPVMFPNDLGAATASVRSVTLFGLNSSKKVITTKKRQVLLVKPGSVSTTLQ